MNFLMAAIGHHTPLSELRQGLDVRVKNFQTK
jgi:hypothetical protein